MHVTGLTGRIVEEIMKEIKSHLKEDEKDHPEHYNRTFEGVLRVVQKYWDTSPMTR